jgi:recombination DNA repair RAD52 pathway protein
MFILFKKKFIKNPVWDIILIQEVIIMAKNKNNFNNNNNNNNNKAAQDVEFATETAVPSKQQQNNTQNQNK